MSGGKVAYVAHTHQLSALSQLTYPNTIATCDNVSRRGTTPSTKHVVTDREMKEGELTCSDLRINLNPGVRRNPRLRQFNSLDDRDTVSTRYQTPLTHATQTTRTGVRHGVSAYPWLTIASCFMLLRC